MGCIPASGYTRQCPRLWTRYLCKSKDCNYRWLDQTLLLPTTDPTWVLYEPLAPQVFREIYASGKNPDGNYWKEFDGSGVRFNLFERACERVPASRPWLLKEFVDYQQEDPPPIALSRAHLSSFLEKRELMFVPRRAVRALQHLRPRLYPRLQESAVRYLIRAATPSTLLFLMTFLHEVVWWARGRPVDDVATIAEDAVFQFCDSLSKREFDDAAEIAEAIKWPLHGAVVSIKYWGDRSPPAGYARELEDLPPVPLLIKDTPEMRDACACLHAAGEESYECMLSPLPSRYGALPGADWAPTEESVKAAVRVLVTGVLAVHARIAGEYERDLLCSPPVADTAVPAAGGLQKETGPRNSSLTRRQVRR